MLSVVDDRDQVVGQAPRDQVHRQGLLHRAVHILVFAPDGGLYLQKRSAIKDTHPLKWTSSASGHADPGESYLQAARRELAEELGLDLELEYLGRLPASDLTENEFTQVYLAGTAMEPRPDPVEILEGRFFSMTEALALAADPQKACPSLAPVLGLLDKSFSRD
jgi:isopentenyl-diphosphate delta-isomerase type 1